MNRTLQILALEWRAALHQLRYDWAREVVVALCSAVVIATFFYIFNDFLNTEVRSLSENMRQTFAEAAGLATLATCTFWAGNRAAAAWAPTHSMNSFLVHLGEDPAIIQRGRWLRSIQSTLLIFAIGWLTIQTLLQPWGFKRSLLFQGVALVLTLTIAFLRRSSTPTQQARGPKMSLPTKGPVRLITTWRLHQALFRNRSAQLCLCLAGSFVVVATVSGLRGAPAFAQGLAGFLSGLLAAVAISFQLADDMRYAWVERCLGVSHEQIVAGYQRVSLVVGAVLAAGFALGQSLQILLLNSSAHWLTNIGKGMIATLIPLFIFPGVAFQIDPKRPGIQALIVGVIGLFLATAIFAHWLSILLLPVFHYYAMTYQAGRFYRA